MKTKLTSVHYLGFTAMDRRFSNAMLPWLLLEIRRLGTRNKLSVAVEGDYLKAYNDNFEPVLVHRLVDIIRASQVPGRPEELFYLMRNDKEGLLHCYLFRASTAFEVTELFGQMREPSPADRVISPQGSNSSLQANVTKNVGFQRETSNEHLPWNNTPSISLPQNCNVNLSNMQENPSPLARTTSNASALTSLCADLSPSDSHFFEVLYIGKVKVSQRKVPDSLIDDALNKFALHEADKIRMAQMRRSSLLSSQATSISSDNDSTENITENPSKASSYQESHLAAIKQLTLSYTSTTPLEPDKNLAWKSAENLKTVTENAKNNKFHKHVEIDDEFDSFTRERAEKSTNGKHIKKPSPVALEPTVLVLNLPKKNLTTLTEDENEKPDDLGSIISDTASSITQFCQTSFLKDLTPEKGDVATDKVKENEITDVTVTVDTPKLVNDDKEENADVKSSFDKESAHVSFSEIGRKPMLMRSTTGLDGMQSKKSSMPENKPFMRDRSASIGTLHLKTPITNLIGEQNRTMLFQVGRTELRLISPDRKQILLHRSFKDVASCVLGRGTRDHFGFICREVGTDAYVCYVFKCESDSVALEVVNAIKQAFSAHAELMKKNRERSPNMTCEHCPMLWYHRLCHDVEGMTDKRAHAFILRRVEQLPEDETEQIIMKYQGGTNHMYEVCEHNAFLMMLLRAHCEAKQHRHVHDTAENRSEFLNQYLGGSTIFMKAKRSLSHGFDHLLKRKASKDDISGGLPQLQLKKELSPLPAQDTGSETSATGVLLSPDPTTRCKSLSPAVVSTASYEPPPSPTLPTVLPNFQNGADEEPETQSDGTLANSPMMDIFLKVGDSRAAPESAAHEERSGTWRQAIFQRVVVPAEGGSDEELSPMSLLSLQVPNLEVKPGRRSREQLRQLWKMAIDQTILLVRMERENARLRESEESSAVRRIKLEYMELGTCDASVSLVWDSLLARDSHHVSKVDHHMLTQAVIQGVPRMCRGGVWYFLAEQACLRSHPPDAKKFPHYHTPYHSLLGGLTKHQHAILIDLGRTFPQHEYFASALGPGQLALYNLLKAYSLLDPDVGYCQGLSFVAGVLLLHMEEAEAFVLLRHLMFRRGLRKQYLPDMSALQIQLYQLSRLLRDHEPELHAKLETLDIAPALYAAPWMLTLFTSQFPLGFVVRVFDLIFLESLDVVFAVSLALLAAHRDGLMLCESCEEAAEYLKHKLPDIDRTIYDKVMKKVLSLDISRQLADYAVEYGVLREEMPRVTQLSTANRQMTAENRRLVWELDTAMDSISNYQTSQSRLENQVRSLEQQLSCLARYVVTHHDRRQDLPSEVKWICQNYNKKVGFGTKISNFSSKFTSNNVTEEEDDEGEKRRSILKTTGMSTPNLFSKLSKDDIMNANNKMADRNKISPDNDKRKHFLMKKSQSVNSGLIAPSSKAYSLKVVEEKSENKDYESYTKSDSYTKENLISEIGKKSSGYFASSHEQIRQERLFAQQLKHDFDENLKKLDAKLSPKGTYLNDLDIFQSQKSLSLNLIKNETDDIKSKLKDTNLNDSGFVTPISPLEKSALDELKKDDTMSVVSHPLSDCDVEIKFDGHSTKLKCIRPICKPNNLLSRTPSLETPETKLAT